VVYSVEHECDLSIENDPISFKQAMNCENSEKWFNAMKEELKSMDDNNVWELVKLPQGSNESGVNGSSRPNVTQKEILKDTKPDLLPKVLLRKKVLTIQRPFLLFLRRTH